MIPVIYVTTLSSRADCLHLLGRTLNHEGRHLEAIGAFMQAISARWESAGASAMNEGVSQKVDRLDEGVLRKLAIAYGELAGALSENGRQRAGIEVGEHSVAILRRLAEVPECAGVIGIGEAVRRSPRAVRDLATALKGFGEDLASAGRDAEALRALNESLGIHRERAKLEERGSLDRGVEAIRQDEQTDRELGVVLGSLGTVLRKDGQAKRAVLAHEEEVRLMSVLAGVNIGAQHEEVKRAIDRRASAVRDLALSLLRLGHALLDLSDQGDPERSEATVREGTRLLRLLAGLGETSPPMSVQPASAARREAGHELAIGLGVLVSCLIRRTAYREAAEVAEEALFLHRKYAGLEEHLDKLQVVCALGRCRSGVTYVAEAEALLAEALSKSGDRTGAMAAMKRQVALLRLVVGFGEGDDETSLRLALARDPSSLKQLALALGYRSRLLQGPDEATEAGALAWQCLTISLAILEASKNNNERWEWLGVARTAAEKLVTMFGADEVLVRCLSTQLYPEILETALVRRRYMDFVSAFDAAWGLGVRFVVPILGFEEHTRLRQHALKLLTDALEALRADAQGAELVKRLRVTVANARRSDSKNAAAVQRVLGKA